ncbi:M6 family metalloprotease-like protein [Streptomyces olivoverticillatus]|uniref:M6 family metalloprotease-like protein n=1 Tax=Streptomyces olivoverticillatus TaxID=66427 RepID=A0A7W7LQQ6_9ACTN|nr:M6 family metalloprotease domain-containing protein [Streptomyces olivoverticillatus]MBB4894683.1 M6 family metalloprotease-like protein [Streptomyces olivoverticillatus]
MKTLAITVAAATAFALAGPVPSEAGETVAGTAAAGLPAAALRQVPAARHPSGPCALHTLTDNVSEGARTPGGYAPSSGTVRAVTFFIDFPDAPAETSPRQRYAEFFPAVADYYRASSYGRLDYRSTPVLRWIRMSRPYAAYGIARGTPFDVTRDDGYHAIAKEILAAVDDTVDFRRYDLINVLATPNAGPPATQDVRSVTFAGASTGLETDDGVPFRNVSFIWSRQTGESPFRVLNHENAHSFGLPDLYDTGHNRAVRTPVGHWDPMDEDWGPSNDFLAWHKWKLGWLTPSQVRCVTSVGTRTYALSPTSVRGGPKLIVVPLSPTRAITLEARAPGRLDHTVCRPGVLITTVATDLSPGTAPVRAADATPGSTGCYTTDANVTPALTDATFRTGQRFTTADVEVTVGARTPSGTWHITLTRRPATG